jgi:hypothetical protein
MKQTMVMDKYPVSELAILKSETTFNGVDEVLDYLKAKIDAHPVAVYIATFDHYTHTKGLGENGMINNEILDAKNIICCFGKALPEANMMAVRPRAIGVAEFSENFVVSFMDAPNPQAHETMVSWVKGIVNK